MIYKKNKISVQLLQLCQTLQRQELFNDLTQLLNSIKMFFGIAILLCYLIGTIGKIFIYNHIKSFKMSERPINILIFLDEMIYHSLITFTTLNLLIVLLADQTPCNFFYYYLGIKVNQEVIYSIVSSYKHAVSNEPKAHLVTNMCR